ncbi:hypothetical protein [Empedobacter sp. UBA7248]|uniref:hypothetical protein n=1 Tax=Empedobacter sp. UBA7248 TaxID=1946448 RepID=UPI0025BEF066|nr:hypothetical protein [Empedobacter sp. UBA7248]
MATINRNGKTYDSVDVTAFIDGIPIEVTSLTYGNEQEHQLNWTLGSSQATSWSAGKRTPSATMGIMMHDIAPIEMAAKGSILDIKPFKLIVSFTNEFNAPVFDELTVKFQNEGREVTGEMGLKKEYTMFALSVKLNTKP